jgi:hypothetical protein
VRHGGAPPGSPVREGFRYSSDVNDHWLSSDDLHPMIGGLL